MRCKEVRGRPGVRECTSRGRTFTLREGRSAKAKKAALGRKLQREFRYKRSARTGEFTAATPRRGR